MYVLGYLPRDGRVYLADKDLNTVSYSLSLSVVEYQTLVLRGDMDSASELLQDVPQDQLNKIARFLEGQGYKDLALEVATDSEHRFDLSLNLGKLDIALEIAQKAESDHKWKIVGDAAMAAWDLSLAQECFTHAKDLGSLLLLHSSSCNTEGLRHLAEQAKKAGSHNIAFSALWQLADVNACVDILFETKRFAEAVLFAQTYMPTRCHELTMSWKENLEQNGKGKVAKTLGLPPDGPDVGDHDLFPEWDQYLKLQAEGGSANSQNLIDVNGEEEEGKEEGEEEEQVNGAGSE